MWPQVRVYDATEVSKLLEKPEFMVMVTEESKHRREMYRAEEKRNHFKQNENDDTISFLKKCHLHIELFKPETDSEIQRCYELIVRTNQLNMSGRKYSQDEFQKVLKKIEHINFAFSCKDDFGEYGIVGFGQYRVQNNQLVFTEFAMSCRVAGKYVESALLAYLLKKENCTTGVFDIVITKKNILLRNTLEQIGLQKIKQTDKRVTYNFSDKLQHSDLVLVEMR